jgi:hypothetical protein
MLIRIVVLNKSYKKGTAARKQKAIWCRDAAYILRDWFLSGNIQGTMQQIYQIWSHQIEHDKEKLVYGRGSPEMKFLSAVAKEDKQKEFQGALPTTIYQAGFSEVYGQNPDIDSTALMISTSSWILARSIKDAQSVSETTTAPQQTIVASEHSSDYISALLSKIRTLRQQQQQQQQRHLCYPFLMLF